MKKALVVVDYQRDFVDGALGFAGAEILDGPIYDKIQKELAAGTDLIFTLDTHQPSYLESEEGHHLPVVHCVAGTDGWKLYGSVANCFSQATATFEKPTFGSFELAQFLREGVYDEVELVGLVSNICVLSNAIMAKAALPEARIVVDARCTLSFDPVMHEKALDVLQGVHVEVVNR